MADPIEIRLVARGVQEIQAIFRTLEQAIVGFERNIGTASERGARARVAAGTREGAERDKAYAKLFDEAEKREKKAVAAAEKAAKEKARAAERGIADEVRAAEKAEQEKQRAVEKSAQYMARLRERSATMAGQFAAREAEKEIAEAKRASDARTRFAQSLGGAGLKAIPGALHGIVGAGRGIASSALQVGGGFSVADSVQRELKLTGIAGNIAASGNADPNGKKWTTSEILRSARGSAGALSMDTEEMLGGVEAFKKLTGNTGRALELAPRMGQLAVATGTNMKDMMSNAGNIALSDSKMSNDDVMRLAMVQTKQGMTGAVEMSDLAKYGGRLTAGASLFGGDRSKNIAMMGAFAQLGRSEGGAASAAEAAMAAQRFATDVQKHAKPLKKMGIEVSDGHGGLRAADEIIKDMVVKTGGDVTKFGAMGLGERGVKVLTAVSNEYRAASGGTRQKGESDADYAVRHKRGMDAVDKTLSTFTSGLSDQDVSSSLKERLSDADKQVEKVMLELRDAVGAQLLPELMKLVPVLRDLTPMIGDVLRSGTQFAEWFANNPFKGIGTIVSLAIAKDIAGAAIGKGMEAALATSIGQKLGSAGLIVGTAAIAITAGMITIDKLTDDLNKGRDKSLGGSTQAFSEAKHIERMAAEGKATPEDLAKLKAMREQMGGQVEAETKGRTNKSMLETLGGIVDAPNALGRKIGGHDDKQGVVGDEYQKARDEQLRQSQLAMKELDLAIAKTTKALDALGKAAGGAAPPGSGPGPGGAPSPSATQPLSARP